MKHIHPSSEIRHQVQTALSDIPWPSVDAETPSSLLARCPVAQQTPLVRSDHLATQAAVADVYVKDERGRMGLGSFKALGAAYVIAYDAEHAKTKGQTYVTASAGNHGLSVAAGAAAFGAKSVIFLAETVPESFADRLRGIGADVRREGRIYEQAMQAAAEAAQAQGWTLLSDSSWPGYIARPHRLMEGYLVLLREAAGQMQTAPTHIFLQAGVGGLAASTAALAREIWGAGPIITVVEPEYAPALFASMAAGAPQVTTGPPSEMGRLDCKEPSLIALKGLARDADFFMLVTEDEGESGSSASAEAGLPSTPSGAAGIAGLLVAAQDPATFGLTKESRVLVILSEASA
ncbi:pyridoxal-phosphate dependent enzyme [Sulfitobacter sp. F26204]|uniref:pyridoxal-phosphate dependent enzyme n=1 Tax=Sulfitobacter sp. F26204 TaxID=2996014 RepID=UPI00225E23C4|nr:pyridoxal-phosphate dependent enzyme [Sulfitobacter sp. F26204]MCX7558746.1 pyridoxal-phosphate dependent enzyme [Sulfitobacter sp. F26204]